MKSLVVAALVAVAPLPGPASAAGLSTFQWDVTNDECNFDAITFASDGTAKVVDLDNADESSAHWSLNGNKISVKFDTWYGGLEGRVRADGMEMQGEETWKSDEKVEQSFCSLKPH